MTFSTHGKKISRWYLALLFCLCIAASPQDSYAQTDNGVGGVLLSPLFYRLNVRAGQRAAVSFQVANPELGRAVARLEILSYLPEEGTYKSRFGETHDHDAATWFSERGVTLELLPGVKRNQSFRYVVPTNTKPGVYWCMLRFAPRPAGSTTTARVLVEVPIMFSVGRERPLLRISTPLLEKGGNAIFEPPYSAIFPVENQGKGLAIVGATGEIQYSIGNRVIAKLLTQDRDVLPGTKRNLVFPLPSLVDGQYRVILRAELGGRQLAPVVADYVVTRGEVKLLSEASIMELPPLAVEPAGITIVASAGSLRSQTLRVVNLSDKPLTIDISPQAVEQTTTGGIGLSQTEVPKDLEVQVSPRTVEIRPKSIATARVLVKGIKGSVGEKWFGLSFSERGNTKAIPETVLGSFTVQGTVQPKLEVHDAKTETFQGRPVAVRFTVSNTGNQALQLVPTATVLQAGVRLIARLEVPVQSSGGILPGVSLPGNTQLPFDLAPGEYTVEIKYQYGEELFATLVLPFSVPKAAAPPKGPSSTSKSSK